MSEIHTTVNFSSFVRDRNPISVALCEYPYSVDSIPKPRPIKKPHGFCLNLKCLHGEKNFIVGKVRKAKVYLTRKQSVVFCPLCKHALFWASKWETF